MRYSYPVVVVEWNDAHGSATTDYEPGNLPHQPLIMSTFGLLLKHDEVGATISGEMSEDGSYRGVTFVPAGMIRTVRTILPAAVRRGTRKTMTGHSVPKTTPAAASVDSLTTPEH